jgi:tellurite resistance protein
MGLFDGYGGSKQGQQEWTKTEAFAGILLATIACDGHISDDEAFGMTTVLNRMRMYQNYSNERFRTMINRLMGVLKKRGIEYLLDRAVEALPEKMRETVFANACDLALADGGVEDDEKDFLDDLQKRLRIPGDTALEIVEVMIIKNKD